MLISSIMGCKVLCNAIMIHTCIHIWYSYSYVKHKIIATDNYSHCDMVVILSSHVCHKAAVRMVTYIVFRL